MGSMVDSKSDHSAGATTPVPACEAQIKPPRDAAFWLVILALNISFFLAMLETSAVSTALPTIVSDLHGTDFVWVGAVYNLVAASFMPSTGGLAQIFGRKPLFLSALFFFSLGSALCGAALNMSMVIAGRAVQGLGGAGIFSGSAIVLSDLVPLSERGTFNGILQLTWCVAAGVGPVVGGTLAERGAWRWLFYLNLPLAGIAAILVVCFLHLKVPRGGMSENLRRMDWIGSALVISSSCSTVLGLTWGGVQFPWSSVHVLVPLLLGLVGLCIFLLYEARWCTHPIVPFNLMSNLTSLSGYLQNFLVSIPFVALIYYLPVYFQACKGSSPIISGISLFGLAFSTTPAAILAGLSVTLTKIYRPQIWLGWLLAVVGTALLSTTHAQSSIAELIGFQIVAGAGYGIIFSTTYFPVLAPLPISSTAHALAFFSFLRQFTQTWGITLGGTILQNSLRARLPPAFFAQVPHGGGTAIAFGAIPLLHELDSQLLTEVRFAFSGSLQRVWQVMAGIAGLGLLTSLMMGEVPLHTTVDKKWCMEKNRAETSVVDPENGDSRSNEK